MNHKLGNASPPVKPAGLMLVLGLGLALSSPQAGASESEVPPWLALGETDVPEGGYSAVPEVLTTARLRQPKARVPGTTTVISGETIRDLGMVSLADVFRLVPGMTVAAVESNQPTVSYHGTVAYEQRRLQVLIDGRTGYLPSLADVDWNAMPVPIELIDRVEISRGPNSAAYGNNAFLASINIITMSPENTAGTGLHVQGGGPGIRNYTAYHGRTRDDYSWRVAWHRKESDGFDFQYDTGSQLRKAPIRDGFEFNQFYYDGVVQPSPQHSLELRAGIVDGIDQDDPIKIGSDLGIQNNPDDEVRDYYLQATYGFSGLDKHLIEFQTSYQRYNRDKDWISCIELGGTPAPMCARLNEDLNQHRLEFELQDTWEINPDLRLVSGLGYREDGYESETYFGGSGNIYQSRLFANLEYTPLYWLTFNAGANYEHTSLMDDSFLSPRLATNLHLTENQSLRFVYSRAVRTPDALEQRADWAYTPRNVSPSIYSDLEGQRIDEEFDSVSPVDFSSYYTEAPGDLDEERITSREISYYGQFRLGSGVVSTEIRYFYDELRDLVAGIINIEDYDLGNRVAIDQQGIELETALDLGDTRLRLTYGYMDQEGWYTANDGLSPDEQQETVAREGRLSVRHTGSLAWIQRYSNDWSSAVAWYVADEFRSGPYQRADLRLAKTVHGPRVSYDIALIMHHYLNDNPLLSRDNNYRDRNQFFLEAGVRF
ncbi:TonB-dependent receptor plug domain-containing protein [Marinobacter bryozoorum]|uniref:TonB-dependent receptor plug domain-containing protein n=1 Tax=Marinobacter bryozoorum TaxID=256324 RepID=UPI00200598EB|nr:TonB-dependent receptor [Marinobacter bryozoorum]MCK7543091.1 TonB-dependent receptor plug domain-containing protein [Marinobacter bryozoorum]